MPFLELVDFQGHLVDSGETDENFLCTRFLEHIRKNGSHKSITDVVLFGGGSKVQLGGELLKINDPKLTVIFGVEHNIYLIFNDI